jgi:signal-transduction protein with cAMP-binding, CBS, and nucleotidyltransferase domain
VVLEEMFLGLFIRHILVEKDSQYVGLLSIGDVIRTSLLEKDEKIKELNSIASWQYYEEWCWKKK